MPAPNWLFLTGASLARFALKTPGYEEHGVDRFLTWNLLFGLKDGTDYTPFLPAHVVLTGSRDARVRRRCCGWLVTAWKVLRGWGWK